ncbi:MAG: sulfotransferase [Acidimicrobiaceae bacterium]|nr:sulfotransferase [Acidimicrobiaceae bacterium]MXW75017.1 sulfotransferase [Acidimicrobiaceae bacterium]MYC42545.1 sulfotransferase [Acidimicrobiaceae bacterium]MYD07540.1 sulfotransferase [Acidimicrobiaceae bacterium]MYI57910.1 sulfotransferase [Acidimicrobiaceae bacterium]
MNLSEDFALETLLAAARDTDGLEDFGPVGFQEPLGVLLDAYASAPLNELGRMILRGAVVHSLRTRLRSNYWFSAHPEIARQRIAAPIVVVGMMRTGTTLVQRLLAADERHYAACGWEIGEAAPRIGWQPDTGDPRIGDAEAREEQTRTFAPDLFSIHPMYAHEAEEEIMFLADAFLSHVPEASADVPSYRRWLNTADFAPAYENLHRMLQLLQWQKQRRGEIRSRWVLKTPAHLGYLNELLAVFPDAHVVHMHRDPADTIPSGASLNTTLWKMHADDVDPHRVGAQWIERMTWTNNRAMAMRATLDNESERFTDIAFSDMVSDPLRQIDRLYQKLGVDFNHQTETLMRDWLERSNTERLAPHRYSAADFGLSTSEIRERFADYMARFMNA